MGKSKRKRGRRGGQGGRKRGGMLVGMRSGFKGMADSVAGKETTGKYKWFGRIVTVLLLAGAVAFVASQL
jgi:hypothetical protein